MRGQDAIQAAIQDAGQDVCNHARRHWLQAGLLGSGILAADSGFAANAINSSESSGKSSADWLAPLMRHPKLQPVFDQAQRYQLQISYRSAANGKLGPLHSFNPAQRWFAPASLVKLPLVMLALEYCENELPKLLGLSDRALWRSIRLAFPEMPICAERSAELRAGQSLLQLIDRALVVSDDSAYCGLYEFLGPAWIAQRLASLGLPDIHIQARFGSCGSAAFEQTGPVQINAASGELLKVLPRKPAFARYRSATPVLVGKAWRLGNKQISGAKDFSDSNSASLNSLFETLQRLRFPEQFAETQRFKLSAAARDYLWQRMAQHPANCDRCRPQDRKFANHYFRLLGVGDGLWPADVKVHNKVGWAYGFLSDLSYLEQGNRACFVGCAMYLNRDEVLNDGVYEYERIGRPFMAELGRQLLKISA